MAKPSEECVEAMRRVNRALEGTRYAGARVHADDDGKGRFRIEVDGVPPEVRDLVLRIAVGPPG